VRNHDQLRLLADKIAAKHEIVPMLDKMLMDGYFERHAFSALDQDIPEAIHERRQIETRPQPEKIAEALNFPREQMLIRDHHRPGYFIWSLELKEDEDQFGFIRQVQENKPAKIALDLSFISASNLFLEYFRTKLPISAIDITAYARGEE